MEASNSQSIGAAAETLAAEYLVSLGLKIIDRNVHCGGGEIDIIAFDDGVLHFVEVKARRNDAIVSPLESITPAKVKRLKRAALAYLQKMDTGRIDWIPPECHFDAVTLSDYDKEVKIDFILDIFD